MTMAVPNALALDAATHVLQEVLGLKLRVEGGSQDLSGLQLFNNTILVRTESELILGEPSITNHVDSNTGWEWREVAVAGRGLYQQGWSTTDRGYQFVRLLDFLAIYDAPQPDGVQAL
jgi:hypothetical protein